MKQNNGDEGNGTKGRSGTPRVAGTPTTDRVCSQCSLVLPWAGEEGALEACWCEYCQREVKPKFRTARERATAFRNTLREVLKLHALPRQVLEELRTCWERSIWTSLVGSDLKPFKTFDDFCRDPSGLGCDPVPVRALLEKWVGAAAFALATTPVAQQGRRTDRLAATSSRRGDKSRPRRTDTRHRTIHSGPEILVTATGSGLLGKMNAEFLAGYAKDHPRCDRLAALLHQLEAGLAITDKKSVVSLRMTISNEVRALKEQKQKKPKLGAKARRMPVDAAPMNANTTAVVAAPVIKLLPAAPAVEVDTSICPPTALPITPEVALSGALVATCIPVLARTERQETNEAAAHASGEIGLSIVGVVRAWRQLVALLPNDGTLCACLDLLRNLTTREPGISDDALYACLLAQVGEQRSPEAESVLGEHDL